VGWEDWRRGSGGVKYRFPWIGPDDDSGSDSQGCVVSAFGSPPVVAARLNGGLGNQLFQFAAGRSLAARSGARLILDATVFTLPQERRKFALSPYAIDAKAIFDGYAYPPMRRLVRLPRPAGQDRPSVGLVDRILYRMGKGGDVVRNTTAAVAASVRRVTGRQPGLRVFVETTFDYDPAFMRLGAETYLDGYWQSARYFTGVGDVIRRELALPYAPNAANARWLDHIRATNSVCVHVRRGDYLMVDHFAQHGTCSAGYYARAMRLITERTERPQFFVFSDDLAWSRRHIAGEAVSFVDANPADAAHDELKLMASCRHHIIANSSLSWWGAWLAQHENQIVVGPDPWFSARKQTPDLFPPGWISLPRG
jgi:hypothetical protein